MIQRICSVIAAVVVVVFVASAPAGASGIPFVICANDECQDVSNLLVPIDEFQSRFDGVINFRDGVMRLFGTMDVDPFISFSVGTTNLIEGSVTYSFLFDTPIVPDLYTFASSVGTVTVTTGESRTATVETSDAYPTFISGYGVNGSPANLGVDNGTAPCVAVGDPGSTTCNLGLITNIFPPTFYDRLQAMLTFDQTGRFSTASWTGTVTLLNEAQTVPEPASLLLVAGGALGLRRRRR